MKLNYKKIGEGEPLFIIHGLFGSSDNWITVGKQLSQHHQVILVDLRNHGDSPHSTQWNYKVMADDIYLLAGNLGFNHINLIGHSMGGKVGMTLAAIQAGFLNKLIVADIAPKAYTIRHREIIDGLLSIDLNDLESRKEAERQLAVYVHEAGIRQFLLKNLDRDKVGFKWKLNLEVINRHLENIGEATFPKIKIETPTLFIRGMNSDYVTDEDVLEIRKYYSNSIVETVGNAGHWLHAEQPEAFVKIVLDFLEK